MLLKINVVFFILFKMPAFSYQHQKLNKVNQIREPLKMPHYVEDFNLALLRIYCVVNYYILFVTLITLLYQRNHVCTNQFSILNSHIGNTHMLYLEISRSLYI